MDQTPPRDFDLGQYVADHPYQTLLVAAGVGYILGGGLFTRLTFNVLRAGLRAGALPLVRAQILGLAESALQAGAATQSTNFVPTHLTGRTT